MTEAAKPVPTPRLRFPGFDGEWEEKKLGDCLNYEQPTAYLVESTNYDDSYDTPVLTAGKTFILGYTNEKEGIFNKGLPVIIFDDFTTATQFVEFPFKAKSSAMKILSAKPGTNIKFAYEVMQTIDYQVGAHERHWISNFSKIDVPFPTLPEQTRIAAALSSLDAVIAAHQSKQDALREHKRGLMAGLFPAEGERVPRLRFPEFEGAGEWEEKSFSEVISEMKTGKSLNSTGSAVHDATTPAILKTSCVSSGVFFSGENKIIVQDEIAMAQVHLEANSILISRMNTPNLVGESAYVSKDYRNLFVPDRLWMIKCRPELVDTYLFGQFLASEQAMAVLKSAATGTSASMKNISQGGFLALTVSLPSLPEQTRIAAALSSLDDLIATQGDKIAALRTFKRGLMQGLFPAVDG